MYISLYKISHTLRLKLKLNFAFTLLIIKKYWLYFYLFYSYKITHSEGLIKLNYNYLRYYSTVIKNRAWVNTVHKRTLHNHDICENMCYLNKGKLTFLSLWWFYRVHSSKQPEIKANCITAAAAFIPLAYLKIPSTVHEKVFVALIINLMEHITQDAAKKKYINFINHIL